MRLRRASLEPFRLPLAQPLATAHGMIEARCGFLVRLEDDGGLVGLGEATPLPEFGTESLDAAGRTLRSVLQRLLDARTGSSLRQMHAWFEETARTAPTAAAALDCAWSDVEARRAGRSLAEIWRRRAGLPGPPAREVAVQALVVGTTPEAVSDSARALREQGFDAFKLKLAVSVGASDIEADLARVAALRLAVGDEARIRLDANEAWTRGEALEAMRRLERYAVDFVEQPVARDDLESLAWLGRESPVAIAADEALLGDGLVRTLEARAARILVVKPAALGGSRAALDLFRHARDEELRIVWSSLLDGAVSRSAALHLAAATRDARIEANADEVHGLGTGSLLGSDLAMTPTVRRGRLPIAVPGVSGLGLDVAPSGSSTAAANVWCGSGALELFEAGP